MRSLPRFEPTPRAALHHLRRRRIVGASLLTLAARRGGAQMPWPDRPVRLVVGAPPGFGPDLLARGLAPHFTAAFGQPFVVENRPGAGGVIGATLVAQATDRHTLGVMLGGPTTVARLLNPATPYDPARDFVPVTLLTRVPFVLTIHPGVAARTLDELLALIRARPGQLAYGSIGPGTVVHLAMEDWKHRLGLDLLHVPYRGFPEATRDLLSGRIQIMFNVPIVALPLLADGRLVALAQTGERRLSTLRDVPTLPEAGLDDAFFGWTGILAPRGFPPEAVARLAEVARHALATDPAARGGLDLAGNEVFGAPPEVLAAVQASEAARWGRVIERLGLRVVE
jgi:tripartite-type tricarboxylate transporter receptor subunit TctC